MSVQIVCKRRLPKRAIAAHRTRGLRCFSSASETWNGKHGTWAAAVRYPAVRRVFRVSAQLLNVADIHPGKLLPPFTKNERHTHRRKERMAVSSTFSKSLAATSRNSLSRYAAFWSASGSNHHLTQKFDYHELSFWKLESNQFRLEHIQHPAPAYQNSGQFLRRPRHQRSLASHRRQP